MFFQFTRTFVVKVLNLGNAKKIQKVFKFQPFAFDSVGIPFDSQSKISIFSGHGVSALGPKFQSFLATVLAHLDQNFNLFWPRC